MNNALQFSIPTSGEDEQRALFDNFRACGFSGLQLKGGQYARYLAQPQRFLAEWPRDGVAALIAGGALDENGQQSLRQIISFAAEIGAPQIVFCHGHARAGVTSAGIQNFARILSELNREANGHGVKISLHHHFDQPVMHRADMRIFFDSAPEVGLTLDTAHLAKSGELDIAGVIREFAPFLDNVHLKDWAHGQFQTLGRGKIDFAPVFDALREVDYRGPLCADEESGLSVIAGMRAAREFLTTHYNL